MKKRGLPALLILLVFALALGPFITAAASGKEFHQPAGKLVILHTNDMHGRAAADLTAGTLGYAAIAQIKLDLLEMGASVLLLDAGDASQGAPIVNMSRGGAAMEFMNAAGYDAMVPGNHEFDWGIDILLQNREIANFPLVAANITDQTSGATVFQPYQIFDMPNGIKVGVFGLVTPETLTKAHPDRVRGIDIQMGEALYAAAQAQIDALKAQGCDLIVCLGHLGVDDESTPNRSLDVLEHTTGIDLFIDGHSHTAFNQGIQVGGSLLVSAGEYGKKLGVVVFDGHSLQASLYANPSNAEMAAFVKAIQDDVAERLAEVFAATEILLDGERDPGVRTQETNLGNFAADAILWAARRAMGDHVEAAITNGGGIRASIQAGDITMNDMRTVFPFGNEVTVLTVTGAELLEALEAATHATPAAMGAFPQVAGIEFTIDTTVAYSQGELYPDSTFFQPAEPGSRVTIHTVGGRPFAITARY
ncbi:MAG: 5'-nucleotidase C-terminal domain-containing protein, partial [Clostridia bacterium]|nr:5'-nucleotidase C-terminal domain-containing protein [Clostridia bacterium]